MTQLTSLEKGLLILRELAASDGGMAVVELAQATDLNRTTVYRIAETLQRSGWVVRLGDEGEAARLELGPALYGLAVLIVRKYEPEAQLRPIMVSLSRALTETVHLGILEGDSVIHVARELPDSGMQLAARLGSKDPAHGSALGKAILATLSDAEVRAIYRGEALSVFTPTTIPTVSVLLRELDGFRGRGYAVDDQESSIGIKCIAAPIFDSTGKALFALSVTTVPQRLEGSAFDRVAEAVKSAAEAATESFGGSLPKIWRALATAR